MYAVIFRARIRQLDQDYAETAARMRELALGQYGCVDFVSVSEGDTEVAISYWPSLEHIQRWKQDPEHRKAQQLGRDKWYVSYQVQVVDVVREYRKELASESRKL